MTKREKAYKKAANILRNNLPRGLRYLCLATRDGLSVSPTSKKKRRFFAAVSLVCTKGFLKVQ